MTPTEAGGLVPGFLAIWAELGGWWVVALYTIYRVFGVIDKHGIAWFSDWLVSKAEIRFLKERIAKSEEHVETCDRELEKLKGNFSDLFSVARKMDRRDPQSHQPPPGGVERRLGRMPTPSP